MKLSGLSQWVRTPLRKSFVSTDPDFSVSVLSGHGSVVSHRVCACMACHYFNVEFKVYYDGSTFDKLVVCADS